MAKFKDVVNTVLYEAKINKAKKGLKAFYFIDIFVEEENIEPQPVVQQPEVQPATPAPVPAQVAQEEFRKKVGKYLKEEVVEFKKDGTFLVAESEADNIQTIEDLVDYFGDSQEGEPPIFNEFVKELILTIVGSEGATAQLNQLLKKKDKLIVEVDYGSDKNDSIGFKIMKRSGVDSVSIMMKKDNEILPGKFNTATFNNQILVYRNDLKKSGIK